MTERKVRCYCQVSSHKTGLCANSERRQKSHRNPSTLSHSSETPAVILDAAAAATSCICAVASSLYTQRVRHAIR